MLENEKNYNFEIIFVDNASNDGSLEKLKDLILGNISDNIKIKIISVTKTLDIKITSCWL